MANLKTNQLTDEQLWDKCDHNVRKRFGKFIREFNKREWSVRIGKTHETFEDYAKHGYTHDSEFGTGFVVSGRPVPYFHPNRSFHDEVIWLNDRLYYNPTVNFSNKLVNSAIVKFYGPSRTLDIITGYASDLGYVKKTYAPYIDFDQLRRDEDYLYTLLSNIELASENKQQLWGTTELRTSLQIAARNHGRTVVSVLDKRGLKNANGVTIIPVRDTPNPDRKMRTSDMILWLAHLAPDWISFYETKPTMQQSYEYLTSYRGIGPYYGYHFSSNLCRMPGIGAPELIEREHSQAFANLGIKHGRLDENADYVVAGPGACATLKSLFPDVAINASSSMHLLLHLRDNQHKYLDISSEMDYKYLEEATELGQFTTFGMEIASCQFNVFTRLSTNTKAAEARANAPISKEVGGSKSTIESFFE